MSYTCLITGANRGLGRGLTAELLARNSTTVVAAVRDVDRPTSKELLQLPAGISSRLILIKIDSKALPDPGAAVESLQSVHGITALDLVIANAGISTEYPTVANADPQVVMEHFFVNVLGPIVLFQAVQPLMIAAENSIFMAMSSIAGSIGGMEMAPFPNTAYGTSKAALNYLTRKIHFENESICAICMHPGWVQTDMGNAAAVKFGIPGGLAETSIEDSVKSIITIIEQAKKETHSGKFFVFTGEVAPW